jgi:uncharacterized protein (TIGR02147 family)
MFLPSCLVSFEKNASSKNLEASYKKQDAYWLLIDQISFIIKGMKQEKPNIFAYIDYRKFLQDYYAMRKVYDPGFTHTYICHRLGQESAKSYFNNIVAGRMDVTTTFIDRFIVLLELDADESRYFRALVNYNQTTSAHEKEFFFDQLVRLNNTPHRLIDKDTFAYYKEWYHSAVRALLDIVDFKDDFKSLANRIFPQITLKQAKESIALLKQLGMIVENENGFWKPTDKVISSGNLIHDALIEQFQIKCLEHAKNVLVAGSDQAHRNITLTISLSDEAFERVTGRIQQFKSEIRSIVQKDENAASRVYHINVNFFPMSS